MGKYIKQDQFHAAIACLQQNGCITVAEFLSKEAENREICRISRAYKVPIAKIRHALEKANKQ